VITCGSNMKDVYCTAINGNGFVVKKDEYAGYLVFRNGTCVAVGCSIDDALLLIWKSTYTNKGGW